MPRPVFVLLPPSETKAPGGSGAWQADDGRFGVLAPQRRRIAAALAGAMADPVGARRLTGVGGAAGEAAVAANRATLGGPVRPAGERYRGVVWDHLDLASLRGRARRRAAGVVVVSALAGLLAVDDPVPDYKVKMGARLPDVGVCSAWWRPAATAALAAEAAGSVVWDLLPAEHARALDVGALGAHRVVEVGFRTPTGGAAGHGAKAVKGRFARHLLEVGTPARDADLAAAVAAFAWPGWRAAFADGAVTVTLGG